MSGGKLGSHGFKTARQTAPADATAPRGINRAEIRFRSRALNGRVRMQARDFYEPPDGEPVYQTIVAFPLRLWRWLVWGQIGPKAPTATAKQA